MQVAVVLALLIAVLVVAVFAGPHAVAAPPRPEPAPVDWRTTTLGIPAIGWLAIVITGFLCAVAVVALIGWGIGRALNHRAVLRAGIEHARITGEPCRTCGADPRAEPTARTDSHARVVHLDLSGGTVS